MEKVTAILKKKDFFGLVAVVIAFVSLSVAFVPKIVETINEPAEQQIDITEAIKDKAKSLFSKEEDKDPPKKPESKVDYEKIKKISSVTSIIIGFMAFVMAIISYIKSENKRLYKSAFSICIVALLVNFHWLAIFMLILFLIFVFSGDFTGGEDAISMFDITSWGAGAAWIVLFIIAIPLMFISVFVLDFGFLVIVAIIAFLIIMGIIAS